jgi:hypothetical protein
MKRFPVVLAAVVPCAFGWWGGSVFLPVAGTQAGSPLSAITTPGDPSPALNDVLAIKATDKATQHARMAGFARLGMDDPQGFAEALFKAPREEGSDPVRDAARALALQSPESCWQFLAKASSDDPTGLRARCEDAAAWAYENATRRPVWPF